MTPDYHPPELKWWEIILLTLIDLVCAVSVLSPLPILVATYMSLKG
jgi:hypothetical protein